MEEKKFTPQKSYYFRLDKRQITLLIGGYLFICVLVFIIGVVVGRGGASPSPPQTLQTAEEVQKGPEGEPASVASTPPAGEGASESVAVTPKKVEDLSFYRTLPDGGKPPDVVIPLGPEQTIHKENTQPGVEEKGQKLGGRGQEPATKGSGAGNRGQPLTPPTKSGVEVVKQPTGQREEPKVKVASRDERPERRDGKLTIQVSSFRELALANTLKRKLTEKGFDAYITLVTLPEKGAWYRVQIGAYQEKADAERVLNRIQKEENLAGLITQR